MTIRPNLINYQEGGFSSKLGEERDEKDEGKEEWVSDAEHEWKDEMEEHYGFEAPDDFKFEEAADYGIKLPRGGLSSGQRMDLARLYARSSPVDEAIWYAVNAYHWHEADWLRVLNSPDAFGEFMRTQESYYKDCLTDSQLVGQTAECAGVEQTEKAMKKEENVFGGIE
jgi:hypothetical protein